MGFQVAVPCGLSLVAILFGSSGFPPLKADEAEWAKRLGVQESYVSKVVQAAGFSEEDEIRIEELDLRNLKPHGHMLLVTAAGNGHCLTLTVLTNGDSVHRVWRTSEAPGGAGFCHDGARSGDFQAHATPDGTIVVKVPKYSTGRYVLPRVKRLVYIWGGKKYVVNQELAR